MPENSTSQPDSQLPVGAHAFPGASASGSTADSYPLAHNASGSVQSVVVENPLSDDSTSQSSLAPSSEGLAGSTVADEREDHVIGVGPWPGGEEAWPRDEDGHLDPRFEEELLRDGDRRNVIDLYRYWTMDAIIADLDEHRHDLHIAIENWGHDLNIGSVVRTANAFAVKEVHIIGRKRWNRRGAMVTDRYQHVRHHESAQAFEVWAQDAGLQVIGIDNIDDSIPIEGYQFPRNAVLVFGQEKAGLTPEAQAISTDVLHITQFGSTRSINAGAAAAIAMHSWIVQHAEF